MLSCLYDWLYVVSFLNIISFIVWKRMDAQITSNTICSLVVLSFIYFFSFCFACAIKTNVWISHRRTFFFFNYYLAIEQWMNVTDIGWTSGFRFICKQSSATIIGYFYSTRSDMTWYSYFVSSFLTLQHAISLSTPRIGIQIMLNETKFQQKSRE